MPRITMMHNSMLDKKGPGKFTSKRYDDQDAIETTDQGSCASDNEVASSVESTSAYQSDVNPKKREAQQDLAWLVPTVGSRRAQLRGVGQDVLEQISVTDSVEPQCGASAEDTRHALRRSDKLKLLPLDMQTRGLQQHRKKKMVLLPTPPGLPSSCQSFKLALPAAKNNDAAQKQEIAPELQPPELQQQHNEKMVLLPTSLGLTATCQLFKLARSADKHDNSAQNEEAFHVAQHVGMELEPAKVLCVDTKVETHIVNPDLPLKKRPLYGEVVPLLQANAYMPMKKGVSSFFFQEIPTVLAR